MTERLSPAQIRGARAMLDWSIIDCARAARVSVVTVKRIENGERAATATEALASVRGALEAQGIQFLPDDGGGPGLRFRAPVLSAT